MIDDNRVNKKRNLKIFYFKRIVFLVVKSLYKNKNFYVDSIFLLN